MAGAVVQHPTNKITAATTCVVTVANPASGNVLCAWADSDTTLNLTTDNGAGGVWTLRASVVDGNGCYVWTKQVAAGDTSMTTVTFNLSSSATAQCGVIEMSGVDTSAAYDTSNTATVITGASGTVTNTVSTTTTGTSGDYVVHFAMLHAGSVTAPTSPSWTNSFVLLDNVSQLGASATSEAVLVATLNQGTAGAISTVASWTTGFNDRQGLIISFKLASAAAAGLPDLIMAPMRGH